MMLTTFMTSRQMILKTGWSQEPQQRMIQKLMLYGIPFSLLLSGWYFPIGVIIYWVVQNIFSLGQQYWVLHKYPPPVTETKHPAEERQRAGPRCRRHQGAWLPGSLLQGAAPRAEARRRVRRDRRRIRPGPVCSAAALPRRHPRRRSRARSLRVPERSRR